MLKELAQGDVTGFGVRSGYFLLYARARLEVRTKQSVWLLVGYREKGLCGGKRRFLALLWLPSAGPSAAPVDVRVQLSQAPSKGIISTTHKKIAEFGICFEVLAARLSKEA